MTTKTDVQISNSAWTNVHTAVGASVGTTLLAQSKSRDAVLFFVAATAPTDNSGMMIAANDFKMYNITPAGTEYLWCKSLGNNNTALGVQA
jgi:hypothetical protein